jgi:hypothetical protein
LSEARDIIVVLSGLTQKSLGNSLQLELLHESMNAPS